VGNHLDINAHWIRHLDEAGYGVWDWNIITDQVCYSKRWKAMLGYSEDEIGEGFSEFQDRVHPDDSVELWANFNQFSSGLTPVFLHEFRVQAKDQSYRWIVCQGFVISHSESAKPLRLVGMHSDITELKNAESQLAFMAHHDALTGLINRTLLHTRLEHAMQVCAHEDTLVAVCFIDIDDFKFINDRYGHSVGDSVLLEVANRLKKQVRIGDSLSRIGGDEFVVVLERLPNEQAAQKIFNELLNVFKAPLLMDEATFSLSASMGVSFFPHHGTTIDMLNRNADTAMYRAKALGKNSFQVYCESMSQDLVGRLEMEADLKEAMTQKQFELYYQPKVNLKTSKVVGFEALIRWNHPVKGLIRPDEFMPLAEDQGYIVPIGEWVLRQACQDLLSLQDEAGFFGTIAVNVSGVQLENSGFLQTVEQIFEQPDITPKDIELEITESAIMNNPMRWTNLLAQLQFMGFKISIDDFGTGYSSLNYLKKLPVNQLKIDKSFVDDLTFDEDDRVIISAVISLAAAMKMSCVAEGIETQAQLNKLVEMGCEQGQGYLFSQPLPLKEIKTWLNDLNALQNLVLL